MRDDDTATIRGPARPRASDSRPRRGVLILFTEGALAGARARAAVTDTTIGRAPDRHVFVEDAGMSRAHATLRFDGSSVRVRDEASHNGTFLNGARLAGEAVVAPGDVIRCGTTLLTVVPDVGAYQGWPAVDGGPLVGGPAIAAVRRRIDAVASLDIEVLLTGETGTGKDVAARLLHDRSRRPGAFVPVNCAGLPATLFESELFGSRKGAFTGAVADRPGLVQAARGGTLFLDEIGDLGLDLQPKLLRVAEAREARPLGSARPDAVDLRLVAASHRDLAAMVAAGKFREDLYHRLCGTTIQMPPLREHREDVVAIAERVIAATGAELAMTAPFVERLLLHPWPGNVRELQQVVREAVVGARTAGASRLDVADLRAPLLAGATGDAAELAAVRAALERTAGNVAHAAADLGWTRARLYAALKAHGLEATAFRKPL